MFSLPIYSVYVKTKILTCLVMEAALRLMNALSLTSSNGNLISVVHVCSTGTYIVHGHCTGDQLTTI